MGTRVRGTAVRLVFAGLACAAGLTHAQVVLDGTLGTAGALSGPAFAVGANLGQQVGGNLFHSFGQINLSAGQSATFSGPGSVQNVISRVTGGASSIDGLLRSTIPNANLFFINPRGITFGPNARLDVMGSFHASTADYLKLGNSGRFDARNPSASVLTSADPSAFGFVSPNPAAIAINGSSLFVPEGKSLSFSAGALGIANAYVSARAGRLTLATTSSAGEIALDGGAGSTAPLGGAISIANSGLDTDTGLAALPSGPIHIRGGQMVMAKSYLTSYNYDAAPGGGIDITLSGELALDNSLIQTRALAAGRAGDIGVQAQRVTLSNGGQISTSSFSSGRGGDLTINASESVTASGRDSGGNRSGLFTSTASGGDAGTLTLSAPVFSLDDAIVYSSSDGLGNAGAVTVSVGRLNFVNGGAINASSFALGGGRGADLRVTATESVTITGNSSDLTSISGLISTTAGGVGGSIYVTTPVLILDGGILATGTGSVLDAPAGNINVQAGSATFVNGGRLDATTFLTGRGGSINLSVSGSLSMSGRRNDVLTENLLREFVRRVAPTISDDTYKTIRPDFGDFASSGLVARTVFVGPGGAIAVSAGEMTMADGARINASSTGFGNAGTISIDAGARLRMSGGASITTEATRADGGNISIIARDLVQLDGSRITTSVGSGFGNGGNITIDPTFVVLNNSQIIANAFGGAGGNIGITTDFFLSSGSVVEASSQLGISGSVTISAPKTDPSSGLVTLGAGFFDASSLLRASCASRAGQTANSLVPAGRGGIAATPEDAPLGWGGGGAFAPPQAGFGGGSRAFPVVHRVPLLVSRCSG